MPDSKAEQRKLQNDLDQAQAAVDLDQGIADREQAYVDRKQEPLDAAQEAYSTSASAEQGRGGSPSEPSADLSLHQDRQDAHQAQIDQTQLAQGVRQDVLDHQQSELDGASPAHVADSDDDLARIGEELHDALRRRAEKALSRAEATRQRASDTLRRLDAAQAREAQRPDDRA